MTRYSPGPGRYDAMSFSEAEETFATGGWSRSRAEKVKVLPGKETRLHQTPLGFEIQYRDTGVVGIHPDGTYTLDHGGYATKMTAQRMVEYAPVKVEPHGQRDSEISDEGNYYIYPDLNLRFVGSPDEEEHSLLGQFFPLESVRRSSLLIPYGGLRVDRYGRPIVADLLSEIAPDSWRKELGNRLQAWTDTGAPAHAHTPQQLAQLMKEEWPDPLALVPMQVRRTWSGNEPVAMLWWEQPPGRKERYRWLVRFPYRRDPETLKLIKNRRSGVSHRLDSAIDAAEKAIAASNWSTAPPTLRQVLGDLAYGPPFGPKLSISIAAVHPRFREREREHARQSQLALPVQHPLLDAPVLRVHWMEPWATTEKIPVPKQPLPGSQPWPGAPPPEGEIRQWFELPDGHAVGISHVPTVYYARSWRERKPARDIVLVHRPTR